VTSWDDALVVLHVDSLVMKSLRGYFGGTAITAVITAPIFVIPLVVLKVPHIAPIVILYFLLSFIPFVGAWVTGAFAGLIALGSSGGEVAAIVVDDSPCSSPTARYRASSARGSSAVRSGCIRSSCWWRP
jgi:hypothetical protein